MAKDPKIRFIEKVKQFPRRKRALTVGDSWFQYPLRSYGDLQSKIAAHFRTKIVFYDDSSPGRDADQLPAEVLPRLNRFASHMNDVEGKPFELILLSLGGNDVIGKDFGRHLKKKSVPSVGATTGWTSPPPQPVLDHVRLDELRNTLDVVKTAYLGILELRRKHAPDARVICHTYADVTPSKKPYQFIGYESGPWMWTPMRAVGLTDTAQQRIVSRWLLEQFAGVLKGIARNRSFMTVLDTRHKLPDYDGWWDNEIHPLGKGYQKLVDEDWIPEIQQHL